MRKSLFSLLAIVVLILMSKSCEKSSLPEEQTITATDIESIKVVLMSGDWMISHYSDPQEEETEAYDGYVLNFNADGILGATNGNSSLSGAWSIKSSVDNEDDNTNEVDFEILFSSPEIFKKLSENWEIKKYIDTKIELMNTSGENGGTYLLTFEKL